MVPNICLGIIYFVCWGPITVQEASGTVPGCYVVGERANLHFRIAPDFPCRLVLRNIELTITQLLRGALVIDQGKQVADNLLLKSSPH